jgi:pimeloyl-ACP methyl ester carboxylesterase
MSTPNSLRLPARARAVTLAGLAAIEATPVRQTRPTVVLVPGYTGSKEDFLSILEQLTAAGHRVIAYDQRGQYESVGDEDPGSYGIPALGGDLLNLLGDEPAHVVGHSFGGLVARAAAIEDPGRFRSLTLLDSGPSAIPGDRAERIVALRPVLLERGKDGVWEYMESAEELPAEVEAFRHRKFYASSATGLLVMGDELLAEPDRTDALRATGVPVLVAYGEDDDAWPPAVQADMAGRLGAAHAVIPGAMHSPAVEQADATARVLLDFWASVDELTAREARAASS